MVRTQLVRYGTKTWGGWQNSRNKTLGRLVDLQQQTDFSILIASWVGLLGILKTKTLYFVSEEKEKKSIL